MLKTNIALALLHEHVEFAVDGKSGSAMRCALRGS